MNNLDIYQLLGIARDAGKAILEIYHQDFEVIEKEDNSPLTLADKNANEVIIKGLQAYYPDIPIISEETKLTAYDERKDWEYFWLVDPLDGTKEFVKKNDEFTVNIALIHKHTPIAGVVHIPVTGVSYCSVVGQQAFKIDATDTVTDLPKQQQHYLDKDEITVVASRSHLTPEVQDFVDDLRSKGKEVNYLSAGSSLKFCLVAEGKADVYPRFGPTMEWDTGAAHAIALGAGLNVYNAETKKPLAYNKENLLNPWFIVE